MSDTPLTDAIIAAKHGPIVEAVNLADLSTSLERKLRVAEDMIVIMEFDLRRLRNEARAALAMIREPAK